MDAKKREEFRKLFKPPVRYPNTDPEARCELCGIKVGAFFWREGENTGCTRAHLKELQVLEYRDLIQDHEE